MVARVVIAWGAMATIPGPRENDADDVSLALEVAQSQWTRGDPAEALKWLRKAADAAFEADDDARGMELSKVAAELKAQIERPAPKPPAPRASAPGKPAMKPSAPPPRAPQRSEPRKPAPQKPPPVEVTGTRRSSSVSTGRKSSVHPKARMDEDEATREYQLGDSLPDIPAAAVADEWPTETLDGLDEDGLDRTGSRRGKGQGQKKKPMVKAKKAEVLVPSTRSVRVAVGADKGVVYVRLLDSEGLREGEHDAMLVALTSDGDIRTLFK
jgi:hypothetical protein